jgi:hypothetical protein
MQQELTQALQAQGLTAGPAPGGAPSE